VKVTDFRVHHFFIQLTASQRLADDTTAAHTSDHLLHTSNKGKPTRHRVLFPVPYGFTLAYYRYSYTTAGKN
jgi:hypothetical protein